MASRSWRRRKESIRTVVETQEFRKEYVAKAQALKTAAAPTTTDRRKRAKKADAAAPTPQRLPVIPQISQAGAARYCFPGGSLWLANFGGIWQAHSWPMPRISRSFKKYGQEMALKLCYEYLWRSRCEISGVPLSKCPLAGIFDEPASAPPNGGSSSSASGARRSSTT